MWKGVLLRRGYIEGNVWKVRKSEDSLFYFNHFLPSRFPLEGFQVQKADVIDVWNGPFEENAELAVVDRIEVMDYALTTIGYDIHVKTWKKFLVSNWKQSTQWRIAWMLR